jgi:precorrin-6Y C5,15-methyltransferase (decarboxylating)
VLVAGISDAGADGLAPAVIALITAAEVLAGGDRHLALFPDVSAERIPIRAAIDPVLDRLRMAREDGHRVAVLASGDPLWYGFGASLRRVFPPEALDFRPAPTSIQLAFAVLGEPWAGAALLSAHGRPLEAILQRILGAPLSAVLTDSVRTPAAIASKLITEGLGGSERCAVCERLGGVEQRIVRTTLEDAAGRTFADPNVFVIWNSAPRRGVPPGLPDGAFSTSGSLITKREVRLQALAELGLTDGTTVWDIGAGSGSVGIEAARWFPGCLVFAAERRASLFSHLEENRRRFPAANLTAAYGEAPEICVDWPDPDAVFVGGSGGRLPELIDLVRTRLRPGGRLVIALATLDHIPVLRSRLPDARLTQIQINRGIPIGEALRLDALNPVFLVCWRRDG